MAAQPTLKSPQIGLSEVRALAEQLMVDHYFAYFGSSEVCAPAEQLTVDQYFAYVSFLVFGRTGAELCASEVKPSSE